MMRTRIQVDMFEVQLGAAILLQFDTDGGPVAVLADAGVRAGGYHVGHVHKKLPGAFDAFAKRRPLVLNLVIGTHYDADHLDGLVPIIADKDISICEAWLPPVANDQQYVGGQLRNGDMLGVQFARGGDRAVLRYLQAKWAETEAASTMRRDFGHDAPVARLRAETIDEYRTFFEHHLADARARLGEADVAVPDTDIVLPGAVAAAVLGSAASAPRGSRRWRRLAGAAPGPLGQHAPHEAVRRALAGIDKGRATDAITAISLANVVKELKARRIPTVYRTIRDGTPKWFRWDPPSGRFVRSGSRASSDPRLCLLGPSAGLVAKHADRLPVGTYESLARTVAIPVESISPSNQLSYVLRLDAADQRVLVTGDAGMVDFRPGRGPFYPRLIKQLRDLDVVQVAHHGGNNAYFYHAVLEAGQRDELYLLLSHAHDDRYRPSAPFAMFLRDERLSLATPRLVFTSSPARARVEEYRHLIEPVRPAGDEPQPVGDVRLEFGDRWATTRHLIDPTAR